MRWRHRIILLTAALLTAAVVHPELVERTTRQVVAFGVDQGFINPCETCLSVAEGSTVVLTQTRRLAWTGAEMASPYLRYAVRPLQEAVFGEGRYTPIPELDFTPQHVPAAERRQILEELCAAKGLTEQIPGCWQLFEAICRVESAPCRQDAYNPERDAHRRDGLGGSYGWYQFRIRAHHYAAERRLLEDPLTCAYDFRCSADWAMDLAIRNGVGTSVTQALYRHNGAVSPQMRERYLRRINERLAEIDAPPILVARKE